MERDYIIAGHRIRIEGEDLIAAVEQVDGFTPFEVKVADRPLATFCMASEKVPAWVKPLYTSEVYEVSNMFGRYESGYLFTTTLHEGGSLQLWKADDSSRIYFYGEISSVRLLRFALWIAYGITTIPHETIAIHTSTIQYKDRCVLFLGESGTGKSTHTRLWMNHIPGAILLNDDSPILRIINNEVWVFGSPWSGKTPCYKNEQYLLAACVRLSQAPYNEIKKLPVLKAYAALHPSCPPDFAYDDNLYESISHTLDKVLSRVPVYHLACLPDVAAAKLSFKAIFGE